MKQCLNCGTDIGDKYKYCMDCVKAYGKRDEPTPHEPKGGAMWHEDATVDALLKMNSNLGTIAKELREIAEILRERP
jgi:hypothetical protein